MNNKKIKTMNIPVFIPHFGCPNDCVFCNQVKISGKDRLDNKEELETYIEESINTIGNRSNVEIAFFGGSFTGLPKDTMCGYLDIAKKFVENYKLKGIRMSTRPDYISEEIISILKKYPVTSIELGVQSLSSRVLELSKRNHTVDVVFKATRLIREAGYELGVQMMLGLPGDDKETIINTAKQLIKEKPVTVRIYPTLVIEGTELEKMYNRGDYKPLSLEEAVDITANIIPMFEEAKTEVIRVGLQPNDDLNGDANIAGPYHPAFRELVLDQIFFEQIKEKLSGFVGEEIIILANAKTVARISGHKKQNRKRIYDLLGKRFKVVIEKSLKDNEIKYIRKSEEKHMIQNLNYKYENRIKDARNNIEKFLNNNVNDTDIMKYMIGLVSFVSNMWKLEEELTEEYFEKTMEELLELNHEYYSDIVDYEKSYANPTYAVGLFGNELGKVLSSVYADSKKCVGYAFEHRKVSLMWMSEYVLAIVTALGQKEDIKATDLIAIIKENSEIDLEEKILIELFRKFSTDFDVYSKISKLNIEDKRYIFRYGMYVGENELGLLDYFDKCADSKIKAMADTYTEAFYKSFERNNIKFEGKKSVNVALPLGFEKMISYALDSFEEKGLKPVVFYDLKGSMRPRIMNTKPSKQFEYDHRFDDEYIMDEQHVEKMLKASKKAMEFYKKEIKAFAGPAVIETFGEKAFAPKAKEEAIKYSEVTLELKNKLNIKHSEMFNKYLPGDEYSFEIISYPLPEVGKDFEDIFDATIEVNTLNEESYEKAQQAIIDVLDEGVGAHITGREGNKTDIFVAFSNLEDSNKQTNFFNCLADQNVPVGEVFTTPKLEGTNGKLHVKEVFLKGLKYIDLDINFKDGYMDSYTCANFENEEDNVNYIRENLTHPHKTLPLGEFAIGTNTTAYVMAKKYKIEDIIPILIGEKTGPHFAIGDSCYTWSEDTTIFNPDGKEIVAKDNSKTILRKTDVSKAYTNCHTDITIPYSELGDIEVIKKDDSKITIIKEGKFVLAGTEFLNEALKKLN